MRLGGIMMRPAFTRGVKTGPSVVNGAMERSPE